MTLRFWCFCATLHSVGLSAAVSATSNTKSSRSHSEEIHWRPATTSALKEELCKLSSLQTLDSFALLEKQQLFEANINIVSLSNQNVGPFNLPRLKELASKDAQRLHHHGVDYVLCSATLGYYLTYPAPQPLELTKGRLKIPIHDLQKYCSHIDVRSISFQGTSQKLVLQEFVDLAQLPKGSFGIECVDSQTPNAGAQLWYLVVTDSELRKKFPKINNEESYANDLTNFKIWLSQVRAREGLPAIEAEVMLPPRLLAGLLSPRSAQHDLKALAQLKAHIKPTHRFIGEAKAIGRTLEELALSLWLSPFHRDLLLSRQADSLTLTILKKNNIFVHDLLLYKKLK